ncbi:MAG TPA: hypothetical protein VM925_12425 [Labilithrix sp.]|nr:hypothetical protein [Labilithrix sp.]
MRGIRQRSVDVLTLKLSPEEGFVLSRVDGTTTVKELAALTGFDEGRIVDIVGRLNEEGAVEVDDLAPGSTLAASVEPPPASTPLEAELLAFLSDAPRAELEPVSHEEPAAPEENATHEEAPLDEAGAPDDTDGVALEADSGSSGEEVEPELVNEREYRKLYETIYHAMTKDERIKAAGEASGSHLIALCLDPDPQVIHAILANTRAGLEHARYIALHHRTQMGLEAVAKRSDHLSDSLVQRRLLRNPQLPGAVLGRIVNPKMMMEVYKVAIDREIPERTRMLTRDTLRKKFMVSSSDERAALLFKTEGRCLLLLTSCSLDAHATQILCSKQNYSNMFVQNLARWSATPPMLLAHLLKNPVVRRNLGLKKMLLRHPNTPSDAKRHAL